MWISALSIILCFAMLAGTTYAWFSDVASNTGNRIRSGILNIDLLKYDESLGAYVSISDGAGDIFSDTADGNGFNWEPGAEATVFLQVKNTGTLELKYDIDFVVLEDGLSGVLELSIAKDAQGLAPPGDSAYQSLGLIKSRIDSEGMIELVQRGELAAADQSYTKAESNMEIDDADFFAIKVKMLQSAGSTYLNETFSADVILTATQTSMGPDDRYDENAGLVKVSDTEDFAAATAGSTIVLTRDITLTDDVNLPFYANIDYAGYTLDLNGHTLTMEDSDNFGVADLGTAKSGGTVKDGNIVIRYPKGTVNTYGTYTNVNFDVTVSANTFHFFGVMDSGVITLNTGRMLVHPGAVVKEIAGSDGTEVEYLGSDGKTLEIPEDAVEIRSSADLQAAIRNQQVPGGNTNGPGKTWVIYGGHYDVGFQALTVSGYSGGSWYFPVLHNNTKIIGLGRPLITSSQSRTSGVWAQQSLIIVFADGVTLENLEIKAVESPNKNIEVLGKNFSLLNSVVRGAAVYFTGHDGSPGKTKNVKGSELVKGNLLDQAALVFDSVDVADSILVEDNRFVNIPDYYAVGNHSWSTPKTLEMADVILKGNRFQLPEGGVLLRNRFSPTGTFRFDDSNFINTEPLTALNLALHLDITPHEGLTADQLSDRLIAEVDGRQIRSGTDLMVGESWGWDSSNPTVYHFQWRVVNKAVVGDAPAEQPENCTIKNIIALLHDKATGALLQRKTAKMMPDYNVLNILYGPEGATLSSAWKDEGKLGSTFYQGVSGANWDVTPSTANKTEHPAAAVSVILENADGDVYYVKFGG